MPTTRRRPVPVLMLLAMLVSAALALGACGSDNGNSGSDVGSILKDTFGSGKPVKSGKLDVSIALDAKGLKSLNGPVAIKLTGPFQSKGPGEFPALDLKLSLDAAGQSFTAGAVSTGDKGFLEVQGQAFQVDDALFQQFKTGYAQAQKESKNQKGGASFKTFGIEPLKWLKDAKIEGTEDVGGAQTTHISGAIDIPTFLDDVNTLLQKADKIGGGAAKAAPVPTTLTDKQRRQIAEAITSAKVDVFTGKDDRILRRVVVAVAFDVPEASRKDAGGLTSGTLQLQLTISDLGKPQTITAPANARPLSDLLGAATGSGSSSSGSGTATTPSTGSGSTGTSTTPSAPAANPEYLDCLDKAGSDLAEVQKCAQTLTQ